MSSGIYQIENQINGKRYIGSAVNLQRRWLQHLAALHRGQHHNKHLQSAFDKYGENAFIFSILEYIEEPEKLVEREQSFLDALLPEYNISPTADSLLGVSCSTETRAKISAAMMGKQRSAETRARMGAAKMGKHPSTEARRKMRAAKLGKHHTEEHRRKNSAAKTGARNPNYGKPLSEATRAKISAAMMGKHLNTETKRKISEGLKAYWRRIREAENR